MDFRLTIAIFNICMSILLTHLVIVNARLKERMIETMGRLEMLCEMKEHINDYLEGKEDGKSGNDL